MIYLIIWVLSYFKGYIQIFASGYFLERFLNLCLMEDILLWDLQRISPNELCAKISIAGFKNLRKSARKTRTKISIKKKYGFPFFLSRNRERKGIIPGIIVFLIIIWYFSTHLMGITIEGSQVDEEKILSALSSYGVEIGMPIKNINNKILKNQLMTSIEDFGWVGVNIKGSRLYITASDREKPNESLSADLPCNIVAAKDGVIRLMEIRDGQTMVLVNTPVKRGDLLVSGVIDSNAVGMRYTHSYGEVWADTFYEEEIIIPLKHTQNIMTKKSRSKYTVKVLNFAVKLYLKDSPPYKNYKMHKSKKEYNPPLKIFPSIYVEKQEFFETKAQAKTRSVSQAVELGKFHLLNKINTQLSKGAVIENITVSHKKQGNNLLVTLKCQARENIAHKTPIDKTEDLDYNNEVKIN